MNGKFDAVAFDIDGTLYPNYRFYIKLIPDAIRHFKLLYAFRGARIMIREAAMRGDITGENDFYGLQGDVAAFLLKEDPVSVKEKLQKFIYSKWEKHFKKIKPYRFVREVIEKIRAAGLKTAVLSDFPVGGKLKNMELEGLWDAEICSEETGVLKPGRKPFDALRRALGVRAERVLYVGNSVYCDVLGARGAGFKTALIKRCFWKKRGRGAADYIFRNYRQLLKICEIA